ncbi:MAG: hypothetical protein EZS28_012241 [Streblomastix strix]|uniref:Uncharacterized protein n=1 Tax=Streblomastix strix TaxID=222440 RepID=A0A5J4WC49_9EUKA|nr:MAG: hypothetical protein EZS28_012241 [Streblomastix strix]
MEKHCPTESLDHDKATSKFHRIFELSTTTNQELRIISTKIEQDQTMNRQQQRLECIHIPKLDHNGKDMLVKSKNKREKTNKGFDLDSKSHSVIKCVIRQLMAMQKFRIRKKQFGSMKLVQEVEATQQLQTMVSGCSPLFIPFRAFFIEEAGHDTENRDRQQCYFLYSEQRGSCYISQQDDRSYLEDNGGSQYLNSFFLHRRENEYNFEFIFLTSDIWRLFSKRRNSIRSSDDPMNKTNCRHVCEQKKQQFKRFTSLVQDNQQSTK